VNIYQKARQLRLKPTGAEELMKHHLRSWGVRRIRRQVVVGKMIVDIAIPAMNLLIEIDGPVHTDKAKDARRDAWVRSLGFQVQRFTNDEVLNFPSDVHPRVMGYRQCKDAASRFRIASRLAKKYEESIRESREDFACVKGAKSEADKVCCCRCGQWKLPSNYHARDGKNQHICDTCSDREEALAFP